MDKFNLKCVLGHIEVIDIHGNFLFSADSISEALKEIKQEYTA